MRELYNQEFYENRDALTRYSAETIVGFLHEIIPSNSVCDVGCGVGTWLAAFKECGATEIFGLDGEWVDKNKLVIPEISFLQADLTAPPSIDRTFDLAISLEVAEHLPAAEADKFVDFITSLAPVVMFSAAIPGQGGIGHVNEQWPSYWISLFNARGFMVIDCIRPQIWDNPDVLLCYQQNTLLFVRQDKKELLLRLQATHKPTNRNTTKHPMVDLAHPKLFTRVADANRKLKQEKENQQKALDASRHEA